MDPVFEIWRLIQQNVKNIFYPNTVQFKFLTVKEKIEILQKMN